MFTASHFTYDGVYSGEFGLKIAAIDGSTLERTAYVSPTITAAKPALSKKFHYQSIQYDTAPTVQFQIISQAPLSDTVQSEVISWLEGRKGYKRLVIHENNLDEFHYNCIFTIDEIIYFAGYCIGFTVTANFDSPYMYGQPTQVVINGTGSQSSITIRNKSTTKDEYVLPLVEFTSTSYLYEECASTVDGALKVIADTDTPASGQIKKSDTGLADIEVDDYVILTNKNISIINVTDSATREFLFQGVSLNNKVTVNNETKIITAVSGTDLLSKFSLNWLRLRQGNNTLTVNIKGQATITCYYYEKIRF